MINNLQKALFFNIYAFYLNLKLKCQNNTELQCNSESISLLEAVLNWREVELCKNFEKF